jgi:hypothetical protein
MIAGATEIIAVHGPVAILAPSIERLLVLDLDGVSGGDEGLCNGTINPGHVRAGGFFAGLLLLGRDIEAEAGDVAFLGLERPRAAHLYDSSVFKGDNGIRESH